MAGEPQNAMAAAALIAQAINAQNATKAVVIYTVATLPVSPGGTRGFVRDALAPAFLGVVAGGGSVVCPVFFNGAAWIVG